MGRQGCVSTETEGEKTTRQEKGMQIGVKTREMGVQCTWNIYKCKSVSLQNFPLESVLLPSLSFSIIDWACTKSHYEDDHPTSPNISLTQWYTVRGSKYLPCELEFPNKLADLTLSHKLKSNIWSLEFLGTQGLEKLPTHIHHKTMVTCCSSIPSSLPTQKPHHHSVTQTTASAGRHQAQLNASLRKDFNLPFSRKPPR